MWPLLDLSGRALHDQPRSADLDEAERFVVSDALQGHETCVVVFEAVDSNRLTELVIDDRATLVKRQHAAPFGRGNGTSGNVAALCSVLCTLHITARDETSRECRA